MHLYQNMSHYTILGVPSLRYGVTNAAAIDGYSRKVVGFISVTVKNYVQMYERIHPGWFILN